MWADFDELSITVNVADPTRRGPFMPLLTDLVVLLLVSIAVLYVSHGARLPPVVGFLISGILVGPHGFRLVRGIHEVEQLAEIGVVLLLFTIGLEFSLRDLLRMRREVLAGGSLQILGVAVIVGGALGAWGVAPAQAVFLGMTASLSSTAVVLRLLQQQARIEAPHGRMSLAMLVWQDLMIVPMMLLVPVLAGGSESLTVALASFAAKSVGIVAVVYVGARFVIPNLLDRVVRTQNRDLFLLTVVTVCLAVAWLASLAGLSLALGAFLAGLLVSESEYSHQALADILPFRDLFAAFFFVSIGMLFDVQLAAGEPLLIVLLVLGLLAAKTVAAAAASLAAGSSAETAALTGLTMSQVGEFSFVLASAGAAAGLIADDVYQWFLAAAVTTIATTPFVMAVAPRFASAVARIPLVARLGGHDAADRAADEVDASQTGNHLVVIGYGVNGRNVSRAARVAGIPHVVVDMNPHLVTAGRGQGVPIHFGDATRQALLEHVGVPHARAVVVAVSDAAVTRQVTALVRALNPACTLVARTRYVREVEALRELGADVVIPEELETSVEIVSRVLASYLVPRREVEAFIEEIRAGGYEMLRTQAETGATLFDLRQTLTDVGLTTMRVDAGSPLAGQRLVDSDLRRLYGVTVVAIRRDDELRPNPGGEERIEAGDVLVLLGLGEEIAAASALLSGEPPERA